MRLASYSKYDFLEAHYQRRPVAEHIPEYARINGVLLPYRSEPRFVGFPSLCPFCCTALYRKESVSDSDDGRSEMWVMECENCGFWEISENRWLPTDGKSGILDRGVLQGYSVAGKIMEYDDNSPAVPIEDLLRHTKKNPDRIQRMNPRSLEQLVARCFHSSGAYVDVMHCGQSHDGGVDVVLVHGNGRKILVQVKRRESAAGESVTTLRNFLGTLVVQGAVQGIIVSSADHFTYCAHKEKLQAERRGYLVELRDLGKLRAMLDATPVGCSWRSLSEPNDLISEARRRFAEP